MLSEDKKKICSSLMGLIEYFYSREEGMYKHLMGEPPEKKLASQVRTTLRMSFLASASPNILLLLQDCGISQAEFADYIKERTVSTQKIDDWYYKQEFEPLDDIL
jgi:hypothetical protein